MSLLPTTNFRILHFLSPVKWKGKMFLNNHDANWKVAKKTIDFLPQCHHFVIVPLQHTIEPQSNVTFVEYDYPRSVQLNRCMFDYRNIKLDFTRIDIDFVFNHEPAQINTIQNWFHTKRYFEDVKYFSFYHWIDCNKSRGSVTGSPSFYMRQLESFTLSTKNFIHSKASLTFFHSNFKKLGYTPIIDETKTTFMPLSCKGDIKLLEPSHNKYSNILVFNHRYNKSSGIKILEKYLPNIPKKYKIWITDERCKLKGENIIVKSCDKEEYNELMSNCHASLSFIKDYSTWNLSAQDSLIRNKPLIGYKHPMLEELLGEDYPYLFTKESEFLELLETVPQFVNGYDEMLSKHDMKFRYNLISSMNEHWKDTKNPPKDSPFWINEIEQGNNIKKNITNIVKPNLTFNASNHYIRRHLLHNGYKDDYNALETTYLKDNDINTISNNPIITSNHNTKSITKLF